MLLRNLVAVLLFCLSAAAQTVPQQPHTQPTVTAKQTAEYTLPADKLRQAEALYKLEIKLGIFGLIYSWAVVLAVLSWGIGARYRKCAERVSCYPWVQALIFVPLLMVTLVLTALPLRMYGHHISVQYGLSVQSWASWFGDWGKGLAITLVLYTPALWLLRVFIRRSPRRWWFYYWAIVAAPVTIILFFITPYVIDPLFNKFEPLEAKNPKLVDAIEKVTNRGGLAIPRSRMFEMKASEKVTTLNAYVTGFGSSKRVVVWDTTIQKLTTAETLFVFGHEMGHYVLHHIIYGLIGACVAILILLYIIYRMSPGILQRFGARWQIAALHDWTAMPMILLLAGVLAFIGEPLGNGVSRYLEHQADIYGLEVTHGLNPDSQEAAAHAFQLLGELSLDYPRPNRLAVFWYWTHPPIADRVRFAHDYDPWSKGEKPKYVE